MGHTMTGSVQDSYVGNSECQSSNLESKKNKVRPAVPYDPRCRVATEVHDRLNATKPILAQPGMIDAWLVEQRMSTCAQHLCTVWLALVKIHESSSGDVTNTSWRRCVHLICVGMTPSRAEPENEHAAPVHASLAQSPSLLYGCGGPSFGC